MTTTTASFTPSQALAWGALHNLAHAVGRAIGQHPGATVDALEGTTGPGCLFAIAKAAAGAIGPGRAVETYSLSDDECEERGLPLGTTEPCIYLQTIGNPLAGRMDAWDDGDGCFHIRAFGLAAEVHHVAREGVTAGA